MMMIIMMMIIMMMIMTMLPQGCLNVWALVDVVLGFIMVVIGFTYRSQQEEAEENRVAAEGVDTEAGSRYLSSSGQLG